MLDTSKLWRARIILGDGSIWRATSFGAEGEAGGELVFNTALTGYQEVLTDPSYHGQVVVMTAPQIGNYGVNELDEESDGPQVAGFVVREASRIVSNCRATNDLRSYLRQHGVVALEGLDTRALTRRIRERGAMRVFMTTEPLSDAELNDRLAGVPELVGRDYVSAVTRKKPAHWTDGFAPGWHPTGFRCDHSDASRRPRIVAFDFGAKRNIMRCLRESGFDVHVVPASTNATKVLGMSPDGIFLSNGPGDPRALTDIVENVRQLIGRLPMFGICLGHQIMALAMGAEIVKLKFGHHGSNHPVLDVDSGRVEITAQNHGFAVTSESLEAVGARVTHVNLNDQTVAGFELPGRRAFAVQFHPEAAPGPHDSLHLFARFRALVTSGASALESTS